MDYFSIKLAKVKTPVDDFWMLIDSDNYVVASGFGDFRIDHLRLKKINVLNIAIINKHIYRDAITKYFSGDVTALNTIKFRQTASPYYQSVYNAMVKIKPGQTQSYQQLAAAAGNPRAVRATASACARNLLPLIIPCHRVVKNDGSIGKYLFGVDIKNWLINHESKNT